VTLSEISGVDGTGTANYLSKWLDANTITNSLVYDNGTNVGIGTTNPTQTLDVNGGARFSGGYLNQSNKAEKLLTRAFSNGVANQAFDIELANYSFWGSIVVSITAAYSNQNSSGALIKQFSVGSVANGTFYTNESRVKEAQGAVIDNVTIGDLAWNSTKSKFVIPIYHIVSSGNNYTVKIEAFSHGGSTTSGAYALFDGVLLSSSYTTTIPTAFSTKQYPFYTSRLGIGTTSPASELHIEASDDPNLLITRGGVNKVLLGDSGTNNGGDLLLYDANGTLKTLLRSGASSYLNGGNVGIGTTSPTRPLSVYNDSVGPIANFLHYTDASNYQGLYIDVSQTTDIVSLKSSGTSSGGFAFFSGNSERVRITSAGNVGIGTTNPISSLDVNGTISLSGETENKLYKASTSPANGVVTNTTVLQGRQIDLYALDNIVLRTGTSASDDIIFFAGNSEKVRIKGSGNVGIGTTSPAAKLDVYSAASFRADVATGNPLISIVNNTATSNTAGTATIKFTQANTQAGGKIVSARDGNYSSGATRTSNLQFYTSTAASDTEKMRITSAGNVGIGTTSPTVALDVAGAGKFTGQVTIPATPSASTDAASKGYVDAQVGSADTLQEVTDNGNTTTNSVGIGTTNPKSKLDVNGVFCVDSKTHTVTDAFTTCLTVNLDSHAGCHVVITVFGDWSAHSSAAYRGEFFLQNGANGYGEPGIILRQDDNTFTGTDQIICQIVDPTSTANPKDFQIQIRHTDTTSPASWTGQLTYTVQGKFNSIT